MPADSREPSTSELLEKALDDLQIWDAVLIAVREPHRVLDLVLGAPDRAAAVRDLREQLDLTELQAEAVLDMQFRRVTARDRQAIEDKHQELAEMVADLRAQIAGSPGDKPRP